jgi:hypothetical protein
MKEAANGDGLLIPDLSKIDHAPIMEIGILGSWPHNRKMLTREEAD